VTAQSKGIAPTQDKFGADAGQTCSADVRGVQQDLRARSMQPSTLSPKPVRLEIQQGLKSLPPSAPLSAPASAPTASGRAAMPHVTMSGEDSQCGTCGSICCQKPNECEIGRVALSAGSHIPAAVACNQPPFAPPGEPPPQPMHEATLPESAPKEQPSGQHCASSVQRDETAAERADVKRAAKEAVESLSPKVRRMPSWPRNWTNFSPL
jgi:hypothetical protein